MFIQTEATPNPATQKFLPGKVVMETGTAEFRNADEAQASPLAARLFEIPGVTGVYFGYDFISVSKDNAEWQHLKPAILGSIMNRRHTAAEYLSLIERIRKARPDIALSGDFITGFPGETDREFEDTLKLVEEVRYAQAFSFKYSTRPGTPGAELKDQVPEDIKAERLERLQALLLKQTQEFNESCIGKEIDLLLEKPGRMPGQLIGRSPWLQSVNVDAKASQIGDIIKVRITGTGTNSLFAERAEAEV